jgi:outer membrane protein assembly factor BamA
MKWKILLICTAFVTLSYFYAKAEDEILLKTLLVKGNLVTDTEYVLSYVTLKEGKTYDIDEIMDEINKSRENLEQTNLFSEIFFNDAFDEEDNLILTIELKEKNYFLFGPGGYAGYQDDAFYFRNSLYVSYINLFGNSTNLYVELPVYENQGLIFMLQGRLKNVRYDFDIDYQHISLTSQDSVSIMPGLAFELSKNFFIGSNFLVNSANFDSFALYPFLESGSRLRFPHDAKRWYYLIVSPYLGYNFTGSTFYGMEARFNYYHDLLLRIIYQLKVKGAIQGGEVPHNLILSSDVRGTRFDSYSGDKWLSLTNEMHIPLPWDDAIVIVPFIDANIIGYTSVELLVGGGLGFHWYNLFQDPLVVEIAFGKGIMLNFQKRF